MRGKSGRIVIDVDAAFKRRLYARLSEEGLTLKEWFVQRAISFMDDDGSVQLDLIGVSRSTRTTPPAGREG